MNLFVYGILAREEALFIVTRIRTPVIPAIIPDHRLERSASGLPSIVPRVGEKVEGVMAKDPPSQYVTRLDWYYGPAYGREIKEALVDGKATLVEAYVLKGKGGFQEGLIDIRSPSAVPR